jgi:hypothetical protein
MQTRRGQLRETQRAIAQMPKMKTTRSNIRMSICYSDKSRRGRQFLPTPTDIASTFCRTQLTVVALPATVGAPSVAFANTPKIISDDSSGSTASTTTLTLPASMSATKTGWIIIEGN